MRKAYLALADGSVYEGFGFGAEIETIGELVFNTGMVGYIETLTDPSYAGQIVMQTFPMIGNYGINEEDFEGDTRVRGYVVREWCDTPSNFRSRYDLDAFLKNRNIAGIYGLDTRAITRKIREHGVMNAMICTAPPQSFDEIRAFRVSGEVERCTCRTITVYPAKGDMKKRVALMDYGAKLNIVRELQKRGCEVTEFPANTPAEQVMAGNFDGLMLSNGPGDPAENVYCIAQLKKMIGKLPIFGICLGHQLMALAAGGRTEKMKYGHRGGNQPVKDLLGSRAYITSQNHGYAVIAASVPSGEPSFINVNDGSCEGMNYPDKKAFTVQFHPEACAGPQDTSFLFDRFISMMGGEHACR